MPEYSQLRAAAGCALTGTAWRAGRACHVACALHAAGCGLPSTPGEGPQCENRTTATSQVVGCIVEHGGQLLLCRRAIEPCRGLWTVPAGFLEMGESTAAGAARETWEEANARVEVRTAWSLGGTSHRAGACTSKDSRKRHLTLKRTAGFADGAAAAADHGSVRALGHPGDRAELRAVQSAPGNAIPVQPRGGVAGDQAVLACRHPL